MPEFGYAGKILKVNLSNGAAVQEDTAGYADKYLGGRGFAAKLFWDMVPPSTRSLHPDNLFVAVTGPTTGFVGIAGCRFQVCGKTPGTQPEMFSYGNLGGKWGNALKGAGFDAVAIQGKADKPVFLYIHDGQVETRDATQIWGQTSFDSMDSLREELGQDVSVLTIGPAGENLVVFATVMADEGASGSGGLGAVMGSKNLKAIVTKGEKAPEAAHPAELQKLVERIKSMRGSAFGRQSPWSFPGSYNEECFGCGIGCSRQVYPGEKGRKYKSFCQATSVYKKASLERHGKFDQAELAAIRLVDSYSLDTGVMAPMVHWLIECYRAGVISEKETGLPFSQAGEVEFIEALTHKIAHREGFGNLLAEGFNTAAQALGPKAVELMWRFVATRASEAKDYDPRLFITTSLFYATEPRRPIQQLHGVSIPVMTWLRWANKMPEAAFDSVDLREAARRYWGGEIAADFSTYEGKALAAKKIQDRVYAKESLILCDLMWPMMSVNLPGERVGDPSLENQIFSAITGKETDEAGLARYGERVCNLERAIQLRMGWGGRKDDVVLDYFHDEPLQKGEVFFNADHLMPGPGGKVISKTGWKLERDKFEKLKTEYYQLRGWSSATGYPNRGKLVELGLEGVASDLSKRGLLGRGSRG